MHDQGDDGEGEEQAGEQQAMIDGGSHPFGQCGADCGCCSGGRNGLAAPPISRAAEEEEDQREAARRPDRRLDRRGALPAILADQPAAHQRKDGDRDRCAAQGDGKGEAARRLEPGGDGAGPDRRLHRQRRERQQRPEQIPLAGAAGRRAQQGKGATGQQHADQPEDARPQPVDHQADRHGKDRLDQGGQGQAHRHLRPRPAKLVADRLDIGAKPIDMDDAGGIAERGRDRQHIMAPPFRSGTGLVGSHQHRLSPSHLLCRHGSDRFADKKRGYLIYIAGRDSLLVSARWPCIVARFAHSRESASCIFLSASPAYC